MSEYIGRANERMTLELTYTRTITWEQAAYAGYGTVTMRRHLFTDAAGNVLTWKTQNVLANADCVVTEGSRIRVKGTVKAHTEYNGVLQTELTRVKLEQVIDLAPTKAQVAVDREAEREAKRAAQLESLAEDDKLMTMTYVNYKARYSDCETLSGSYERDKYGAAYITVIVRAGRLKASGVRGKHFSGYVLENAAGGRCTYRAVSEENALKQAAADFPGVTLKCVKVYRCGVRTGNITVSERPARANEGTGEPLDIMAVLDAFMSD